MACYSVEEVASLESSLLVLLGVDAEEFVQWLLDRTNAEFAA